MAKKTSSNQQRSRSKSNRPSARTSKILTLDIPTDPAELVSTLTAKTNAEGRRPALISWSAFRSPWKENTTTNYRLPGFYVCTLPRNSSDVRQPSLYDLYEIAAQGDKHDVDIYWVGGPDCTVIHGPDPTPYGGGNTVVKLQNLNTGVELPRCRYVERVNNVPGKATNYAWVEFDGPFCILLAKPFHGYKRPTSGGGQQDGDGSPPPPEPGGDYSGDQNETN